MAGGSTGGELAALDRAARAAYAAAGRGGRRSCAISPASSRAGATRPGQLAERLEPYTTGSLSALFSRPTSVRPDGQLVCFSLRGLPERLKPVALCSASTRSGARSRRRRAGAASSSTRPGSSIARAGRRRVPPPARQERPQALVRPDDDHPGRRRPARDRARAGDRRQRRQPDPAAPGAAGDRPRRRGLPADRGRARYLLTLPARPRALRRRRRPLPAAGSSRARPSTGWRRATPPSSPRRPSDRARLHAPALLLLLPVLVIAAALGGDQAPPSQAALADIPAAYLALYQQAGARASGSPGSSSPAIGKVESDHGRDPGNGRARTAPARSGRCSSSPRPSPSTAGPPGRPEPEHRRPARRDLGRGGDARRERRPRRHRAALYAYNHADWYVERGARLGRDLHGRRRRRCGRRSRRRRRARRR